MADYFADAYFGSKYWTANYFQGGEVDPNAMSASLSGTGGLTADLTAAAEVVTIQGGGWLSKEQLREYEKRKRRKRSAIDDLETTVERAYSKLHGKAETPPVETPAAVVVAAKEVVKTLATRKAGGVASADDLVIFKEIRRLLDAVVADMKRREQEEEEAIVLLLAA